MLQFFVRFQHAIYLWVNIFIGKGVLRDIKRDILRVGYRLFGTTVNIAEEGPLNYFGDSMSRGWIFKVYFCSDFWWNINKLHNVLLMRPLMHTNFLQLNRRHFSLTPRNIFACKFSWKIKHNAIKSFAFMRFLAVKRVERA